MRLSDRSRSEGLIYVHGMYRNFVGAAGTYGELFSLIYTDQNVTYTMDVQYIKVDNTNPNSRKAWFAGHLRDRSLRRLLPGRSLGDLRDRRQW
jgi:hypothetical protein